MIFKENSMGLQEQEPIYLTKQELKDNPNAEKEIRDKQEDQKIKEGCV
jgi:hypothetical protein